MQTSQLFRVIACFLFLVISSNLVAKASYVEIERKFLNANWSFVPEVPQAFKESRNENLAIGTSYKEFSVDLYKNDMNLSLERVLEPKKVSLRAKKKGLKFGYKLTNGQDLFIDIAKQIANEQRFSCYQFSAFIVGGCMNANIGISSTNEKYKDLGSDIISIQGSTYTWGIGYKIKWKNFFLDELTLKLKNSNYQYDWLTPLEDIRSPVLLGLQIDGVIFGDALNDILNRLPQKESWSSNQLNFKLRKSFLISQNFSLLVENELIFLKFSNYKELIHAPKYNHKMRGGFSANYEKIHLLIYGDYYHHNLIGFEPIVFNQRTEHYFDEAYGELGLQLRFSF